MPTTSVPHQAEAEAREALEKYSDHIGQCDATVPCNCGLSRALKPLEYEVRPLTETTDD